MSKAVVLEPCFSKRGEWVAVRLGSSGRNLDGARFPKVLHGRCILGKGSSYSKLERGMVDHFDGKCTDKEVSSRLDELSCHAAVESSHLGTWIEVDCS